MENKIELVKSILEHGAYVLAAVCVLATVIVRITPNKEDDAKVGKIGDVIFKVFSWLPTIGVNPQTKKLKEAVEELKNSALKTPAE